MKDSLISFGITFVVTFVVCAIVTFLYSFVAHGEGIVDWDTVVLFAVILGIVLPIHRALTTKGK